MLAVPFESVNVVLHLPVLKAIFESMVTISSSEHSPIFLLGLTPDSMYPGDWMFFFYNAVCQ